jgi:predicted Fe-Mo cluster-binding NifX family protein
MKIVITANGRDLDAATSPVFGRAPVFLFVDSETMAFEAVNNPAQAAAGGAGIQAAQFVVKSGAQAIVSGTVGPHALDILQAAGVSIYTVGEMNAREAVQAFREGHLPRLGAADVEAHGGTCHCMALHP